MGPIAASNQIVLSSGLPQVWIEMNLLGGTSAGHIERTFKKQSAPLCSPKKSSQLTRHGGHTKSRTWLPCQEPKVLKKDSDMLMIVTALQDPSPLFGAATNPACRIVTWLQGLAWDVCKTLDREHLWWLLEPPLEWMTLRVAEAQPGGLRHSAWALQQPGALIALLAPGS